MTDWPLAPVVRALQALRGMALVGAATLVAELGDITRFANPCRSAGGASKAQVLIGAPEDDLAGVNT